MVPLTIMVIGPVSTLIANALAAAYNGLYAVLPWLASAILGAVWQVLVVFGVHWSFTPISMANFQNMGYDLLQPCQGIAVCAQTAACFGVFWKSRNSQITLPPPLLAYSALRNPQFTALRCALRSHLFAVVSEPPQAR